MKARNDNRRSKFYFSKIYGLTISSNFENSKFDAHSFQKKNCCNSFHVINYKFISSKNLVA